MSANVPAHTPGSSSSFERKAPYNDPPSKILGDTKWCRNCERCHEKDMCQLPMVERLIDAGFQERHADISRLLLAGWERRHSQNLRALQLSRATNSRVNGGNTASASQQPPQPQPQQQQPQPQQSQQAGLTASQVSEGPDEISDSEDPSDYEDESNVDGESDSGTSESAPAPEVTNAKEKSDTGNFKESEELFCFFALSLIVFLIILCAFWGYLGAKFGVRLGLVVYGV